MAPRYVGLEKQLCNFCRPPNGVRATEDVGRRLRVVKKEKERKGMEGKAKDRKVIEMNIGSREERKDTKEKSWKGKRSKRETHVSSTQSY